MGVQLGNGMLVEIDFTPRQSCIRWLGQMSIWTISGVDIHFTKCFFFVMATSTWSYSHVNTRHLQNLDSTFGSVRCHPEQQWLCCFKCERHRIHAHWTQVHARTICEPLLCASNSLYILSTEQTAVCFPHMGPQQIRTVLW